MSGMMTLGEITAAAGDAYGAYQGDLADPTAQAAFGAAVAGGASALAAGGGAGGFLQGLATGIAPAAAITQMMLNVSSLQNATTPGDKLSASLGILSGAAGTLAGLMPPSPQKAALTAIAISATSAQLLVQQRAPINQAMKGLLDELAKGFINFGMNFGNGINGIEKAIADFFTAAQSARQRFGDPLTLDLNNNGIETVPLKTPPLFFDLTASGIKTSVGWIAPSDGLLVLDRNGNGIIDNGAELFGDATPAYPSTGSGQVPTGTARTADGFAALAQEDTNGDGMVNNLDANWANLKVWQDLNQDGISQANELTTLDQQGIASFNVGRTLHSQMLPSGNQMADLGTFTRTDGTTGSTGAPQAMADINLALDTFHRTFADTIPLTATAQALPDMQGSGKGGNRVRLDLIPFFGPHFHFEEVARDLKTGE